MRRINELDINRIVKKILLEMYSSVDYNGVTFKVDTGSGEYTSYLDSVYNGKSAKYKVTIEHNNWKGDWVSEDVNINKISNLDNKLSIHTQSYPDGKVLSYNNANKLSDEIKKGYSYIAIEDSYVGVTFKLVFNKV